MGTARFGEAADGDPRHDAAALARMAGSAVDGIAYPRQVHGAAVLFADGPGPQGEADAVVTTTPGLAVAVATADCVPVVITGTGFAAVVHAGWRGAAAGVVEATLDALGSRRLVPTAAAIGPAIGPCCYEVGADVAARFPGHVAETTWGTTSIDLPGAVADALAAAAGDLAVWRSDRCTHTDPDLHSFRRDATGQRQVAVAWVAR